MPDQQVPLYVDAFTITPGVWGTDFQFGVHGVGDAPTSMHTAIGMSKAHAMVMAYLTVRQLLRFEEQVKLAEPIPDVVFDQVLKCKREVWNQFWYGWKDGKSFGGSVIPQDGVAASDGAKPAAPQSAVPL